MMVEQKVCGLHNLFSVIKEKEGLSEFKMGGFSVPTKQFARIT